MPHQDKPLQRQELCTLLNRLAKGLSYEELEALCAEIIEQYPHLLDDDDGHQWPIFVRWPF